MKNILVIFGGQSIEHEVSIITGVMTANSLDKQKYKVVPVFVDKFGNWYSGDYLLDVDNYKNLDYKKIYSVAIIPGSNAIYKIRRKKFYELTKVTAVINCIHGQRGEDGSIAGLLKMSGIPLVSPPMLPSAIFMDKEQTKLALKSIGVKTIKSITIKSISEIQTVIEKFGFPLIVKPVNGGSSIGIGIARDSRQLLSAVSFALTFDKKVIIEPLIEDFIEINCACYENEKGEIIASECEQPIGRNQVLSFEDKYSAGKRVFPANIPLSQKNQIHKIIKKVYLTFNFTGVIRVDFFIYQNKIYVNEVNTVPGSLAYYLFCNTLKEYTSLLEQMINVALINDAKENTINREYKSGILSFSGGKSSKRVAKTK